MIKVMEVLENGDTFGGSNPVEVTDAEFAQLRKDNPGATWKVLPENSEEERRQARYNLQCERAWESQQARAAVEVMERVVGPRTHLWQTGGWCMVAVWTAGDGGIFTMSDELVLKYESAEAFAEQDDDEVPSFSWFDHWIGGPEDVGGHYAEDVWQKLEAWVQANN